MSLERGLSKEELIKLRDINYPDIRMAQNLRLSEIKGYNRLTGDFISDQEHKQYREKVLSRIIP